MDVQGETGSVAIRLTIFSMNSRNGNFLYLPSINLIALSHAP